jgi:hypothetical protein
MIRSHQVILVVFFAFFSVFAGVQSVDASIRTRGSLEIQSYGYEDETGSEHLWLMQTTRFSIYRSDRPLSFHFAGGYIGDNHDDFSASGRDRFLKGYLQYGNLGDRDKIRLGRFFVYRGVTTGVLDGIEVERKFSSKYSVALFSGLLGPMTRKFEFENPTEAFAGGGEVKYNPANTWKFRKLQYSLSYSYQMRDAKTLRNRLGLSGYGRLSNDITLLATLRLRMTESPINKALARARYTTTEWNAMVEGSFASFDVADYSWFSSFEDANYMRVRFAVDRYLSCCKWGGGLEGRIMLTGEGGMRIGPVITTPVGQIGYRLHVGGGAAEEGPWANLRYSPINGLETYANGSLLSYEWEDFDIESEELISVQTGLRYTPAFRKDLTLSAEYQVYQTPQFTSDRRVLGGIKWSFDCAGRSK